MAFKAGRTQAGASVSFLKFPRTGVPSMENLPALYYNGYISALLFWKLWMRMLKWIQQLRGTQHFYKGREVFVCQMPGWQSKNVV